ncbi:hypothetical protein [Paracoccus methylarcula]|uniref:Uncharacterized protein n=1 Tax=Paracoccus methylarcula TaxID=72022 RepID=A0A3R7Q2C7_9RHOB|nr:hypothetical protein [Paracoccus methylarcula]RNF34316.1 hypothetical protein A7A09_010400 [Paracoccus methylarcula]
MDQALLRTLSEAMRKTDFWLAFHAKERLHQGAALQYMSALGLAPMLHKVQPNLGNPLLG